MLRSRLLLLAAAVLMSTAGAPMKLCGLLGLQIAGGRSLVAGLFLLVAVPQARRWPTARAALAVASYATMVILFTLANKLTTAANAIFLESSAPLWVLVLSPALLSERASRGQLLAIPVCQDLAAKGVTLEAALAREHGRAHAGGAQLLHVVVACRFLVAMDLGSNCSSPNNRECARRRLINAKNLAASLLPVTGTYLSGALSLDGR